MDVRLRDRPGRMSVRGERAGGGRPINEDWVDPEERRVKGYGEDGTDGRGGSERGRGIERGE